jgi:hypothetical protein
MKLTLTLLTALLLGPLAAPHAAEFHVAAEGRDTNPGTAAASLATLERARQAAREKVAAGLTWDVRVLIRGGNYEQAGTIAFGPPDSGSEKYSITYAAYPGEQSVLSGGRRSELENCKPVQEIGGGDDHVRTRARQRP